MRKENIRIIIMRTNKNYGLHKFHEGRQQTQEHLFS